MNVAWLRWLLGLMFCYDRGLTALEQHLPRRVRGVRNQPSVVVMFWGKVATKSDDHCIFMHLFPILHFKAFFSFMSLGNKNALGTFDSTDRWGFQRQKPRVLSCRKTNPLAQKLSSPKWAARGFETVWEPKKWQAVAVVVVPRLQLQILGLDVRLPNFIKFRQWHGR